jgi:general secretion pathway protein B
MSYILDALKKSEQDRGHGSIPGVQTVHSSSLNYHQEKRPVWPWFLAALIVINLVAVIYFIQSKNTKEPIVNARTDVVNESPTNIVIKAEPFTKTKPMTQNSVPNVITTPAQNETTVFETQAIQQTEPIEPVFETVDLYDLPLNVRQHIPEMNFSAHVYSSNPLQRSLVINGRFMEEGSQINSELTLSEITSDGAVFNFQGYRFSTSVLSGWN